MTARRPNTGRPGKSDLLCSAAVRLRNLLDQTTGRENHILRTYLAVLERRVREKRGRLCSVENTAAPEEEKRSMTLLSSWGVENAARGRRMEPLAVT